MQALCSECMKQILLVIVFSSVLIGCDRYYAVGMYSYEVSPIPDMQCILNSSSSIEGVEEVSYSIEEGGRPLTITGIQKPNVIHRFLYVYHGVEGGFHFIERYNGDVEFHHSYGGLNWVPPEEDVNAIRPLISELVNKLEIDCSVSFGITHKFDGIPK